MRIQSGKHMFRWHTHNIISTYIYRDQKQIPEIQREPDRSLFHVEGIRKRKGVLAFYVIITRARTNKGWEMEKNERGKDGVKDLLKKVRLKNCTLKS